MKASLVQLAMKRVIITIVQIHIRLANMINI